MNAIESLKAVLCGPDGKCCIHGSQADRDAVDLALLSMTPTHKDHRAVIEQLVGAITTLRGACAVAGWLTSPEHVSHMDDSRAALTAVREALAGVQVVTGRPKDLAGQAEWLSDKIMGNDYIQEAAMLLRKMAPIVRATHPQASEPIGINGLTESETNASMSVMGLSKPTVSEPAGWLTDDQIRSIAESVGEEMWPDSGDVGWTDEDTKFHRMFFARALAAARTQPDRVISKAEAETILRTINGLRYDNNSAISEERFHEASEILRNALG